MPISQCPSLRGRPGGTQALAQHFHASEMPWLVKVDPVSGRLQVAETGDDLALAYRDDLGVYLSSDEAQPRTAENGEADGMCPIDFRGEKDW